LHRQAQSDAEHFRLFEQFVRVDVPAIDWKKPANCFDLKKIEAALHFRCVWTIQMGANLLGETADHSELLRIVGRLLDEGRGPTLWAASRLAMVLKSDAQSLLVNRLNGPLVRGCEHIASALQEMDVNFTDGVIAAIRCCLLHDDPDLALAAARLADRHATADCPPALYALLCEAYAFWQTNEEPYPLEGGTVPTSPRAPLLSASAKMHPVSDNELLGCAADTRYDVREVANEMVFSRLPISATFQAEFLKRITNGALSPSLLRAALSKEAAFDNT
jgi:hypothetical protein